MVLIPLPVCEVMTLIDIVEIDAASVNSRTTSRMPATFL